MKYKLLDLLGKKVKISMSDDYSGFDVIGVIRSINNYHGTLNLGFSIYVEDENEMYVYNVDDVEDVSECQT